MSNDVARLPLLIPELPARRLMGRPELASLAVAIAALFSIVAGSIWLAERTGDALGAALRLEDQRALGQQVLIGLQEAETGQRGYLLTGKDQYRAPYEAAREAVPALLARLEADSAGVNAAERDVVGQLHAAADAKLAELAQTVALFQSGKTEAALNLVQTDTGERLMTDIRHLVDTIGRDQSEALRAQVALVQSRRRTLIGLESVGLALVLVMAGMIALGVRSYLGAVRASGRALARSNAQLAEVNTGLDEQVRARTADLQAANEEIQRFAYIVSHDLRAPLVNIMGFTSELEQAAARLRDYVTAEGAPADLREAAEQEIPEALGFIKTSTGKMDRLINAILRLSREGRRVLATETLDMAGVCREIAAALRHQAVEKGAEIEIGTLPDLTGDRVAIEQVFTNVVDNALKYLSPARPGHIRISGRVEDAMARFDIADNGRGIAARDMERVFELFRRAGDQTVPGEGIGLAHVRALVRRLGGSIVCESQLNVGTTFTIRLPRVIMGASAGASRSAKGVAA